MAAGVVTRTFSPLARPHGLRLAAAALAPAITACSVIYDPSQFRSADAALGLDTPGLDATAELDAARTDDVGPDDALIRADDAAVIDASSDAYAMDTPEPTPDVFARDAFSPDALPRDAFVPDATLRCDSTRNLELPICSATTALHYCAPDGDTAVFPRAMAEQVFPGAAGFRVGLLGNAVDVVRRPIGAIDDHELSRDGSSLTVLVAGATDTHAVGRRVYALSGDGLTEGTLDLFEVAADEVVDVAVSPGVVSVLGREGSAWRVWSCSDPTTCSATTLSTPPPGGVSPLVASAEGDVAVAFHESGTTNIERIAPSSSRSFATSRFTSLRGTAGRFVYTTWDDDGSVGQHMYDLTASSPMRIGLGAGRARLTRLEGPEAYGLVRIRADGGTRIVSRLEVACPSGMCGCVGIMCDGVAVDQAAIVSGAPLIDWEYHELGSLHVAVLLVGDSAGTEVQVAMWGATTMPTITPITIGSGIVGPDPGVGSALRSVVTLTSGRLEVFAATHVAIGSEDVVYLSGLRLERCGS